MEDEANSAKEKAALSSVLWSALLTVLKLVAGISTNSLGMLSEALHSTLDFAAAGITFLAVRIAAIPADHGHPFGHGKVENLSALAETLLLVITCGWILYEAFERLFLSAATVEPSWWAFAIIIISLLVDINRAAMLRRVAKEHKSQALEADAMHFSTDILSSAVVLLGLICVELSTFTEEGSTLHKILTQADAVAALGVAMLVLKVSWSMGVRSVRGLMDGGMEAETKQVADALAKVAPAFTVRRIRVRESGAHYFVDLEVAVPSSLHVEETHGITEILTRTVQGVLPAAECEISFVPDRDSQPDLYESARHLAAMHGLSIHALTLNQQGGGLHIFTHVELPPEMPLTEAHSRVTEYEHDLKQRLGAVHVITHLEPQESVREVCRVAADAAGASRIRAELDRITTEHPEFGTVGGLELHAPLDSLELSFRCVTDGQVSVAEAHDRASRLEAELRKVFPDMGRINIHMEPKK